jgi:NAD(P)-dependent dehydrogenase (short-subunit alcohol dehydrogenase family)
MRLQGRIALVTGGASGIGQAVASRFAAEGARVAVADLDEAKSVAAAQALGGRGFRVDVRDQDEVTALIERVEDELGPIGALVTSAGIGASGAILDTTLDEWNRILAVNLTGTFITTQAVGRRMVERGTGSIVLIGSINSRRPVAMRNAYAVSKAGVLSLMQVMAMELGPRGVRINGLAPGPIETPLVSAIHTPAVRAAYAARVPQGRYGTPAEVAAAALFLCSDDASYVNGHMLDVDGGFDAVGMVLQD